MSVWYKRNWRKASWPSKSDTPNIRTLVQQLLTAVEFFFALLFCNRSLPSPPFRMCYATRIYSLFCCMFTFVSIKIHLHQTCLGSTCCLCQVSLRKLIWWKLEGFLIQVIAFVQERKLRRWLSASTWSELKWKLPHPHHAGSMSFPWLDSGRSLFNSQIEGFLGWTHTDNYRETESRYIPREQAPRKQTSQPTTTAAINGLATPRSHLRPHKHGISTFRVKHKAPSPPAVPLPTNSGTLAASHTICAPFHAYPGKGIGCWTIRGCHPKCWDLWLMFGTWSLSLRN